MPALSTARVEVLGKLQAIVPKLPAARVTSASGSTVTAQINTLGIYRDDSFVDTHWLILPNGYDGSSVLEVSLVSAFDQDDGSGNTIVTVNEPFSGTVASGVAAYLSPVHPADLLAALNAAGPKLFPWVSVPRRYHHVGASHVFNGFFDFWNGTLPQWWARSTSDLAVTRDKIAYFGESSVKLVNNGGAAAVLYTEPVNHNLLNRLAGENVTAHMYAWCDSGSCLGIRITDGDGNGTVVYHTGGSTWEKVSTAEQAIAASTPSSPIRWDVVIPSGATGYVSVVWTTGGPAQEILPIPPQFRRGPSLIERTSSSWPTFSRNTNSLNFRMEQHYPTYDSAGNVVRGTMVELENPSGSQGLMYLRGDDYLNIAALETDVYEISEPLTELLYLQAIIDMKRGQSQEGGSGAADFDRQLKRDWEADLVSLMANPATSATHAPVTLNPMFGGPGYGRVPERFSLS